MLLLQTIQFIASTSFLWNICCNKDSLFFQLIVRNIYRKQSLRDVSWNQLESKNIETLYVLVTLKEQVLINHKKACCYGTSMSINIVLTYCICYTHISHISWQWSLFILPEIHQKTRGFLMFSGGIERDQCMKSVNSHLIFSFLICDVVNKLK